MAEYIEKKKVIKEINSWWRTAMMADGKPTLSACVKELPTADVVERKRLIRLLKKFIHINMEMVICSITE